MNCELQHILQGIYEGKESALAECYHLFCKKLIHFSKAITHSQETAEEIVEDVFVKLWCKRKDILQIENLSVYLYVSVKNRSLNAIEKKARELVRIPFEDLEVTMCEPAPDPFKVLINIEMMQAMQKAMESLPPRCKLIFKMVREDGLRYKEVAEILNISVNTIDVQIAIATKKICAAMQIPGADYLNFQSLLKKR